jgi:predicted  nucleic acid-binding Zn-ribbon protein
VIKLEDRVTKLEREMVEVRRDLVGTIRTELRAHIKTLEALRENQLDMGARMDREFADVRGEIADVRGEIADVRGEVADLRGEMRDGFTKINLGMAQMTALLNIAIGRDEPTN